MSLLSNLLAFSSLSALTSQREQRSSSVNTKFLFEANDEPAKNQPKQRIQSKSLSKLNLISLANNSKIDPKYRYLHRMVHSFSMKVRKHYYAFFVTLEAMKKNNRSPNKASKNNKQKLESAIAKIEQTLSIRYMKQYENNYKGESFKKIKEFGNKAHLPKTASKLYIQNKYKQMSQKLFNYFKEFQKVEIKVDLMVSAIQSISKKYNEQNVKYFMQVVKQLKKQNKPRPKQISIFELFDGLGKSSTPISSIVQESTFKSKSKQSQSYNHCKRSQNQPKLKDSESNFQLQARRSSVDSTWNRSQVRASYQSKVNSLQASPLQSLNYRSKSPYASCRKILNLKESVVRDNLQSKGYQKMYKSYQVKMDYNEQPLQLSASPELIPKKMNKLSPQELPYAEVEDLADKSNIFRDFKGMKMTEFENLEISNVVGDPFNKNQDRNRAGSQISQQKSQIMYIPYLPYQNSLSSINNRDDSSFGCDAVNFKNSLVQQRQSMKKTGRQKVEVYLKNKTIINSPEVSYQISSSSSQPKSRLKNKFMDRKMGNNAYNNYEPAYKLEPDYIQSNTKQQIEPYNIARNSNSPILQSDGFNQYDFDEKMFQNQFAGNSRPKSYSNFNEYATSRLPFSNEPGLDRKLTDTNLSSLDSSLNLNTRQTNEISDNRSQMPVRDVGLEPLAKMKMKNLAQSSKEPALMHKKFINISKR